MQNKAAAIIIRAGVFLLPALLLIPGIIWAVHYFAPFRIDHIQLAPVPDNRLRMVLEVETNKSCDAVIAYWLPGSGDTLYSTVSRGKSYHAICLTNLQGPRTYQFRVLAYPSGIPVATSLVHSFSTGPIYQATPYFSLDTLDASVKKEMKDTYFLTQILTEPGSAVIFNYQGDIVWYAPFNKGIKVSHWTKDKTVLCIAGAASIPFSGGDEIIEMDLTGKMVTDLITGKGEMDKLVHHEVRKDSIGNIYALTFDKRLFDLTSSGDIGNARSPGHPPKAASGKDTVSGDGIVLFSKTGHKLWEWSVFDHLDPRQDTAIMRKKKDWLHANALYRDKDGNFLISFRNLNQVWKVEYGTGRVLWKLGQGGDYRMADSDLFSGQHAVHMDADKELLVLDNGVKKGLTRALSFRLDTVNRVARSHIDVTLPKDYFNTSKGSVQLLDGNKLLFSLTDPRLFLLTDLQGKTLWKVDVGGDPYRIEAISDFLNARPSYKL
ncbi:MAG: hypothetical protein BGO55_21750 [Sphingobacteriales bacterium 50-39]|nr:aryl-sulfate sulfotransferase [Sphingobacteriales bacterium]OJW59608.1 MAG: hypothetical protein BGO55_21750 [Sphingobacteriales bacterium 50-39]